MIRAARALAAAGALAIMGIGARFLVRPEAGLAGFGVTAGDERALTAIKGVRDISSGLVLLTVWRWGSPRCSGPVSWPGRSRRGATWSSCCAEVDPLPRHSACTG